MAKKDYAAISAERDRQVRKLTTELSRVTGELRAATGRRSKNDDLLLNKSLLLGSAATQVLIGDRERADSFGAEALETGQLIDNVIRRIGGGKK